MSKRPITDAAFLVVDAGVRYWEDATVNKVEDTDGTLIPFRVRNRWQPTIRIADGVILDWPKGTVARVHYKVCDDGSYQILDAERRPLASIDGYVPGCLSPGDNGYGDYIILDIDGDGRIAAWEAPTDYGVRCDGAGTRAEADGARRPPRPRPTRLPHRHIRRRRHHRVRRCRWGAGELEAARRAEGGRDPMNETVRRAGERAAEALARLESTFRPDRYKLTFVARYVGPDELDADIIVSADDTDAVAAVLAKHKDTKAERL